MNDMTPDKQNANTRQSDTLAWGIIELQVTDLDRAVEFWTNALGLVNRHLDTPGVALGTKDRTLIILHAGATKPVAAPFTGMYHVAIGVRTQSEFSRILARLIHLKVHVSPTDHLMAKSLYIADPDGLEIEITYETPERFGQYGDMSKGLILYDADGQPHSGRDPLDVPAELSYAQGADVMANIAEDSYLAHLHFKVAAIEPALDWFTTLGFSRHLTLSNWGFADMNAGAENTHRLAMNIWAGPNRPQAPNDMARLVGYELLALVPEVYNAATTLSQGEGAKQGQDPNGVAVTLTPAYST